MLNITVAAFTFTIMFNMGCVPSICFYLLQNFKLDSKYYAHSLAFCYVLKLFFTCILSHIITCFLLHSFDSVNSCKTFFTCIVLNFASCILLHSYIVTSFKCFFTCILSHFAESFSHILQFCQLNYSLHSVVCFNMFSLAFLHPVISCKLIFTCILSYFATCIMFIILVSSLAFYHAFICILRANSSPIAHFAMFLLTFCNPLQHASTCISFAFLNSVMSCNKTLLCLHIISCEILFTFVL